MKKLFVCAVSTAMVFGLSLSGISAAEDVKDVDVIYDNSETITDPTDPDATPDANWGVKVPAAIQFTDNQSTVSAPVELVGLNGTIIGTINKTVNVSVKSKNGMKLLLNGNDDPVDYTLAYGDENVTGTAPLTLTLNSKTNTEVEGTATKTGTATKKGMHKDTLTYSVALAV